MPIPVPIPSGAYVMDDATSAAAEAFVATIAQIFRSGTTGATINTPPTLFPDGTNPAIDPGTGQPYLVPLVIDTAEEQLFYRQLAIAVATAAGSIVVPPTPTPQLVLFDATCPSGVVVGDLVRISSAGHVALTDITSVTLMPAVGVVKAKASSTECTVQTHGYVQGIFSGLTAGLSYYVSRASKVGPLPIPTAGETLYWQAVGVALDATTLILIPSMSTSRITG